MPHNKFDRLTSVPDEIVKKITRAQASFFDDILELLSRLEVKGGVIVPTPANQAVLDQLFFQVNDLLVNNPDYVSALREYSSELAKQANVNDEYFKDLLENYQRPLFAENLLSQSRKRAAELLLGSQAEAQLLEPLKDILSNAVSSGASYKDTVKAVRTFSIGDTEKQGKLEKYARQIVYDNFAKNDAAYSQSVSNELGFEWFRYTGRLLKSSRPFCVKMVEEEFFHKKEIELLGEGIGLDGKELSQEMLQGRIEGTNKETIMVTRGGHNCQHIWMPVSIFEVPKEVIQRNIAKGFYKP